MERLEKVEKVVEKTGVTMEEAKAALDANDWDVLDAIVWLERSGKTAASAAAYTTQSSSDTSTSAEMSQAQSNYEQATKRNSFSDACSRAFAWVKRILKKSVDTSFVAERAGRQILSVPVLLLIALLLFAFWIVLPLLVVGLFFDIRYHFEGIGTVVVDINEMADKASDGVGALKKEVMNGFEQAHKDAARTDDTK